METIEGNKLIAEFMGFPSTYEDLSFTSMSPVMKDRKLKYHESWDWLMPVVEKIESYKSEITKVQRYKVQISSNECLIYSHQYDNRGIVSESKIQATWLAVVTFIQWYNTALSAPAQVEKEGRE